MNKEELYLNLLPRIQSLIEGEKNTISNLANIAAALNEEFRFFWVGFYLVNNNILELGPFQGPVACTRISFGKGVCGKAWQRGETILVDDVHNFDGHIACSPDSKSEIVVPVFKSGVVKMVLDIDSDVLNHFDEIDKKYLEKLAEIIENSL